MNSNCGEGRLFDDIDQTFWPVSLCAETSLAIMKTHRSTVGDHAKDLTGEGRTPSPTTFIFQVAISIFRTVLKRVDLVSNSETPFLSLSRFEVTEIRDRREVSW